MLFWVFLQCGYGSLGVLLKLANQPVSHVRSMLLLRGLIILAIVFACGIAIIAARPCVDIFKISLFNHPFLILVVEVFEFCWLKVKVNPLGILLAALSAIFCAPFFFVFCAI